MRRAEAAISLFLIMIHMGGTARAESEYPGHTETVETGDGLKSCPLGPESDEVHHVIPTEVKDLGASLRTNCDINEIFEVLEKENNAGGIQPFANEDVLVVEGQPSISILTRGERNALKYLLTIGDLAISDSEIIAVLGKVAHVFANRGLSFRLMEKLIDDSSNICAKASPTFVQECRQKLVRVIGESLHPYTKMEYVGSVYLAFFKICGTEDSCLIVAMDMLAKAIHPTNVYPTKGALLGMNLAFLKHYGPTGSDAVVRHAAKYVANIKPDQIVDRFDKQNEFLTRKKFREFQNDFANPEAGLKKKQAAQK